ncbi:hypothetical protein E3P81_03189 [Wallemia ichthyophaga]|nr:hypothetical protein E3P97_03269 [Wallemia ichthyophaga]TIB44976.1 hypothetical protein E3P82_03228 [Wallemia ichthyophaga]TIB47639.1 hypothetical protein E3P81_03189 [Wallemia ichthyophaga]TIB50765.1 hypothetical protein E3P80_03198 [Wallemia ichthyophaga]TIB57133.1 hypothetical protein E3P79_03191 [Wallemia ichthyophaga]
MSLLQAISTFFNPQTTLSSIPNRNRGVAASGSPTTPSVIPLNPNLNKSDCGTPPPSSSTFIPNSPALHPFPPPSPYPPLKSTYQRIKKWSKSRCPEIYDTLNIPASILTLDALELNIGFQLPPAVRDYFLVHDGQDIDNDSDGLLFGLHLLPIDDVLEQYDFWRSVDEHDQVHNNHFLLSRMKSVPHGWVKCLYSNPAWLPLATDKMGNYIGVDLDPPTDQPGAVPGQVILFGRDIDTKVVVCHSDGSGGWGKFMSHFADLLETDQVTFKHDDSYLSSSIDSIDDYIGSANKIGMKIGGEYKGWDVIEALFDKSVKFWSEIGLGEEDAPALNVESPHGTLSPISIPQSSGKQRAQTEPIPSTSKATLTPERNSDRMRVSHSDNGKTHQRRSAVTLPPAAPIDLPTSDQIREVANEARNEANNGKSWILPSHVQQTVSKQKMHQDYTNGDITELRNFGRSSTPTLSLTSTSNATVDSLGLEHGNGGGENSNNNNNSNSNSSGIRNSLGLAHSNNSDESTNPMASTIRLVHSPERINKSTLNKNEDFQDVSLDISPIINATVIFRVVSYLGILTPNDFTTSSDHTEFTYVNFEYGALREDAKLRVERRLRVLLNADDGELEGSLEFRVSDVCLLHTQARRSNETLKLWRFAGKVLTDKGRFSDHSLPRFLLLGAGFDNLENLFLCDTFNFWKGNAKPRSFIFTLLFDG